MTTDRPSQVSINAALQIAYKKIESKQEYHICHALPNTTTGDYLRAFVSSNMRSSFVLKEYGHHPFSLETFVKYERNNGTMPTVDQMREYRLAWLQYMMS